MGFSKKHIVTKEIKAEAEQYPYALVNSMSEIYLGAPENIQAPWEEWLDARFFSSEKELHIFKCEKEWKAVIISDLNDSGDEIVKSYQIADKFNDVGKKLLVKEYLTSDADGQVYVEQTRLCGIIGGNSDGEK